MITVYPSLDDRRDIFTTVHDLYGVGGAVNMAGLTFTSTAAWGTANLAKYIPLVITQTTTVDKIAIYNGATINGNFDVGIYNGLSLARLVSSGSTAHSGGTQIQTVSITSTTLPPGFYFVALAFDGTTATLRQGSFGNVNTHAFAGCRDQGTAFPLPATAVLAIPTTVLVPLVMVFRSGTGLPS